MNKKKANAKWFWAMLVTKTELKGSFRKPNAIVELWKNLYLVEARDASDAMEKAEKIGRCLNTDFKGTLRLDGKPARMSYVGLEGIGLIHEPLRHGGEIYWTSVRCQNRSASSHIKSKKELLRNLKTELNEK